MSKQQGLTLIELLVVVLLVTILSLLAYPQYQSYVLKGYRAEGKAKVLQVLQVAQNHYSQNLSYSTELAVLELAAASETHRYQVELTQCAGGLTLAQCVAVIGRATGQDPQCAVLSANSLGLRGSVEVLKAADRQQQRDPGGCWQ